MVAVEFQPRPTNPSLYLVDKSFSGGEQPPASPNVELIVEDHNIWVEPYNTEKHREFIEVLGGLWYPGEANGSEREGTLGLIESSMNENSSSSFDIYLWKPPENYKPFSKIESKLYLPDNLDGLIPIAMMGYTEVDLVDPQVVEQLEQYTDPSKDIVIRMLRAYYNHYFQMVDIERSESEGIAQDGQRKVRFFKEERSQFIDSLSRKIFLAGENKARTAPTREGASVVTALCSSNRYKTAHNKIYNGYEIIGQPIISEYGIPLNIFLPSNAIHKPTGE